MKFYKHSGYTYVKLNKLYFINNDGELIRSTCEDIYQNFKKHTPTIVELNIVEEFLLCQL